MVLNKNLQVLGSMIVSRTKSPTLTRLCEQEINIQNMNVELVAQMFKNYRSNVLFHLEGNVNGYIRQMAGLIFTTAATESLKEPT